MNLSKEFNIAVLAGLIEKSDGKLYNTYICVSGDELIAKYRKLHPFISKYMTPGNEYCAFDLNGWKCGILICYDNNVIRSEERRVGKEWRCRGAQGRDKENMVKAA